MTATINFFEAQAGRRNLQNAIGRPILPQPQVYTYDKYLSDNAQIVDAMVNACSMRGKKILVEAPTSAGKTHLVCTALAQRLKDANNGKQETTPEIKAAVEMLRNAGIIIPEANAEEQPRKVIIAVPTNLQSWQGKLYGTSSIAGDSKDDFQIDKNDGKAITTVYDCCDRLLYYPDEMLRRVVLVIDEFHQILSARSYRSKAIKKLIAVSNRICEAGGTVICMTATPASILYFWQYGAYLLFTPASGIKTNIKHIDLVHKTKDINFFDAITNRIVKAKQKKETPVVMVQNKEKIAQLQQVLADAGIKALAITSDSKERNQTEDGVWDYVDGTYKSIINCTIPFCDALLCTSILECGTSITGRKTKDGTIIKDSKILPIYTALDGETNIDSMTQFFARFRFDIDNAEVLISDVRSLPKNLVDVKAGAQAVISQFEEDLYSVRKEIANAFEIDLYRKIYKSLHGHTDTKGIDDDLNTVDFGILHADAVAKYYNLIYRQPADGKHILSDAFAVPVDDVPLSSAKKHDAPVITMDIADDMHDCLINLMQDTKAVKAIISGKANAKVAEIKNKYPEASRLLKMAKPLLAGCMIDGSRITAVDAMQTVILSATAPEETYITADGKEITADEPYNAVYRTIAVMDRSTASKILDTVAGYNTDADIATLTTPETAIAINQMDGDKWRDYITMWTVYRQNGKYTDWASWQTISAQWADATDTDCRRYRLDYQYSRLNRAYKADVEKYMHSALPEYTRTGAEHMILLNPDKYLYKCLVTTTETKTGKAKAKKDRNKTGEKYDKPFLGRYFTKDDLQEIADGLEASVCKICKNIDRHEHYTANDIMYALVAIYSVQFIDKNKKAVSIDDVKDITDMTGLSMRIRSIRYNMLHKELVPTYQYGIIAECESALMSKQDTHDIAEVEADAQYIIARLQEAGINTNRIQSYIRWWMAGGYREGQIAQIAGYWQVKQA